MLPLWAKMDLGVKAMKGYSSFPKLQHYWSLVLRLFNDISRTLIWVGADPYAEIQSVYCMAPDDWVKVRKVGMF